MRWTWSTTVFFGCLLMGFTTACQTDKRSGAQPPQAARTDPQSSSTTSPTKPTPEVQSPANAASGNQESTASACASFCGNIPLGSQGYVPQCQKCPGVTPATSTTTSVSVTSEASAQGSGAVAYGCANYCGQIPLDSQGYDPQCRACPGATTQTAGRDNGCASYCVQIPSNVHANVPDCVKCGAAGPAPGNGSPATPVCASYCGYIPVDSRPNVPACQRCP